jgi:hypothetical protein
VTDESPFAKNVDPALHDPCPLCGEKVVAVIRSETTPAAYSSVQFVHADRTSCSGARGANGWVRTPPAPRRK